MKIAIIDDSQTFLKHISNCLKKIGCENFYAFKKVDEFLEFIKNNEVDVIIIDYIMPDIDGITLINQIKKINNEAILIMLTSSKDEKLKELALNSGVDEFLNKDISFYELKAKLFMLKKLVDYKNKEKNRRKTLKRILEYKDYQEEKAKLKQKKLIKNELKNFFEGDYLFENYNKSLDILNGDSIFSMKITDNKYLIGIIDAMGKGLSASLTSINSVSFIEYSIKKAIEYNDFNFHRLIRDFFEYAKNILIDDEILCSIILCIDNDTLHYANFGMPPIYTKTEKIIQNNSYISKHSKTFKIDTIKLPNQFLIMSDGVLESRISGLNQPYFVRFKQIFPKITFIKDLIDDFTENAIQSDDISIFNFKKDDIQNKILEIDENISSTNDIDKILQLIYQNEIFGKIKDKLIYILQELLMNSYEHALSKKEENSINVKLKFYKENKYFKLHFIEDSCGFDVLKSLEEPKNKYGGKGLKIIHKLADAIFYNKKGNEVKIFLKD
jgi:CheY-like chemotaxis protein